MHMVQHGSPSQRQTPSWVCQYHANQRTWSTWFVWPCHSPMLEALLPTYISTDLATCMPTCIHTHGLPSFVSDLHAMHNCAGGHAVGGGCSIARCVLMLLLRYLHYLWFTGCAWDAMCAMTHISAGEHGFASHTVVPCVPILAGAW